MQSNGDPRIPNRPQSAAKSLALIADDNSIFRDALRKFLEGVNLEVCEATTAREAIECAKQRMPDVIILDLMRQSVNGVEAASIIRQFMPKSRIIIFSLYSDWLGKAASHAAGIDFVVEKFEGAAGLVTALQPFVAPSRQS